MPSDDSHSLVNLNTDENASLTDRASTPGYLIPHEVKFSQLAADAVPYFDLPPDTLVDVYYATMHEPRCQVCKSPYRTIAEHVFLSNGQRPQAVVNYFLKHYGAYVSWEAVAKHMRTHCNLEDVVQSGLKMITLREDELGSYLHREKELAITGILMQIDAVQAMACKNNHELQLKKADMIRKLFESVNKLRKERDEDVSNVLNPFTILARIMNELTDEPSKDIVRKIIKETRQELSGDK